MPVAAVANALKKRNKSPSSKVINQSTHMYTYRQTDVILIFSGEKMRIQHLLGAVGVRLALTNLLLTLFANCHCF